MGKQINFWMGGFQTVAQTALDCGCSILRCTPSFRCGAAMDIVIPQCYGYYFYLPETGAQKGLEPPADEAAFHFGTGAYRNTFIEAGFSARDDARKQLCRSRLYTGTGAFDGAGVWFPRPQCLTEVYNRLVRVVKKLAPRTELTDFRTSMKDGDYLQTVEWRHKEYITPAFLDLKLSRGSGLVI